MLAIQDMNLGCPYQTPELPANPPQTSRYSDDDACIYFQGHVSHMHCLRKMQHQAGLFGDEKGHPEAIRRARSF